ncbi:MAG: DNA-binding response regulator [Firmicutes bacterium HGW-Firmicutes-5]|nr:MAG: DNA-binding response regulator [Firmicutes bacterium HGW-Firmicutes-5]
MDEPKKILIVDDEKKIVEVLKAYLSIDGYKTFEAYNGKDAIDIFERISPSLVILDLMLPDIMGEDVCKIIRKKSRTPFIMLTAKTEEYDLIRGFNIGADDYIMKPFRVKEVLVRVAAVLRRTNSDELVSEPISFGNEYLVIDFKNSIVKKQGIDVFLTPTEFKILSTLAKTPNKVFTRDEIIVIALKDNFNGYDRSIDTYIKNIRQKIEPDSKVPKFLITVHGTGYKFGAV